MYSPCKIGNLLKSECDKMLHTRKTGRLALIDMSDEEKYLLQMRSGLQQLDVTEGEIMFAPLRVFHQEVQTLSENMCRSRKYSQKTVCGSLRTIDIDMHRETYSTRNETVSPMCGSGRSR